MYIEVIKQNNVKSLKTLQPHCSFGVNITIGEYNTYHLKLLFAFVI